MYKSQGVGAEDYGPPVPTVTQQATQAVTDINKVVEETTGLKNFAIYAGVLLIGCVAYSYYNGE